MNGHDFIRIGRAGEYKVLSELIRKDFEPYKPCIDNGVDFLLDNGLRIQVKTSENIQQVLSKRQINPTPAYYFNLYEKTENVDIVICHILGTNDFFIIPKKDLKSNKIIRIPTKNKKSYYYNFLNNWLVLRGHLSS